MLRCVELHAVLQRVLHVQATAVAKEYAVKNGPLILEMDTYRSALEISASQYNMQPQLCTMYICAHACAHPLLENANSCNCQLSWSLPGHKTATAEGPMHLLLILSPTSKPLACSQVSRAQHVRPRVHLPDQR